MNEKQLKEFFTAIGTLAEMALLFYRSSIAAKATPEEAFRIDLGRGNWRILRHKNQL